jgi:hypothetical protein
LIEIKSREDIPAAMQKNDELLREAWSMKAASAMLSTTYNIYITGKHSDEIYQEVKFAYC